MANLPTILERALTTEERELARRFFTLLSEPELRELDNALPRITNAPAWWLRDLLTEALAHAR